MIIIRIVIWYNFFKFGVFDVIRILIDVSRSVFRNNEMIINIDKVDCVVCCRIIRFLFCFFSGSLLFVIVFFNYGGFFCWILVNDVII